MSLENPIRIRRLPNDLVPTYRVTIDDEIHTVAAMTYCGRKITAAEAEAVVRDDRRSLRRYPATVERGPEIKRFDCDYDRPEDFIRG